MACNFSYFKYGKNVYLTEGAHRNKRFFSVCFLNKEPNLENIVNFIGVSLDVMLETIESKYTVGTIGIEREKNDFNIEFNIIPTRREFDKYLSNKVIDNIINENGDLFWCLRDTSLGFLSNKRKKVLWGFGCLKKRDTKSFLEKYVSDMIDTFGIRSPIVFLDKKIEDKKEAYIILLKINKKEEANYFT